MIPITSSLDTRILAVIIFLALLSLVVINRIAYKITHFSSKERVCCSLFYLNEVEKRLFLQFHQLLFVLKPIFLYFWRMKS